MLETGEAFDADDVFAYLRNKVAGRAAKCPKPAKLWTLSMSRLQFIHRAGNDLDRLLDFLLKYSRTVAESTTELVIAGLQVLIQHPRIGRIRSDGLREPVISRGKTGYIALYPRAFNDAFFNESNAIYVRVSSIFHPGIYCSWHNPWTAIPV